MMTLRALQALAQEKLRRIFHLNRSVLRLSIPDDRRMRIHIAAGGDDFTHELVVRNVVRETFANPLMEGEVSARVLGIRALVAQQRTPFAGKVVGVFVACEQALDHGSTLMRISI